MFSAIQFTVTPEYLLAFLTWFGVAAVFALGFAVLYAWVTPHNELKLIREGNVAAAVAYIGTMVGYALVTSSILSHSVSIFDFMGWALIAAVVQLLAFFVARLILGDIKARFERGDLATGLIVAGISITAGLINAGCMTPA